MEHPVHEIAGVIKKLTTGTPDEQKATLNTYFTSDASFVHPFCWVPPFPKGTIPLARDIDSLWAILGIYRWYRILSPHIDIEIDSAVLDQRTNRLYVSIRQTFSMWFIPFHKAPVSLVTVLDLTQRAPGAEAVASEARQQSAALAGPGQERSRYYITKQDDRYQSNDCIRLVIPWVLPLLWAVWQLFSTWVCVAGSVILMPLYLILNNGPRGAKAKKV